MSRHLVQEDTKKRILSVKNEDFKMSRWVRVGIKKGADERDREVMLADEPVGAYTQPIVLPAVCVYIRSPLQIERDELIDTSSNVERARGSSLPLLDPLGR